MYINFSDISIPILTAVRSIHGQIVCQCVCVQLTLNTKDFFFAGGGGADIHVHM